MSTSKRKSIPPTTRDSVLRESGYMCGNPTCRHILTLELHHIVWVKDGGGNDEHNLIALCPNCHSLHTSGHIPTNAIRHWKGILTALNHAFSKESMDLLLFLSKKGAENIWLSGDGLLKFAGLIASDFVEVVESEFSIGICYSSNGKKSPPSSPPVTSVRLDLTDKGKMLVEAWKEGDEQKYLNSMKHESK
ncbi:MAG: HNH endonuclease signature motif containing protein [Candidatus Sedimenticola sp. (ex Thyasira tokunagai)]